MKCPKCSFISFDYNQTCPKCGNDLSHEQDQLNLPSYKPKSLSLLGGLTGGSEIPAYETTMIEQSEILDEHPGATEDLLMSLDTLSDSEPEPVQIDPEPAFNEPETLMETGTGEAVDELMISLDDLSDDESELMQLEPEPEITSPETKMETGTGDVSEELSISLDDLSDDKPEIMEFETEPGLALPETEIEHKIVHEPDLQLSEEGESQKDALWETQAIEKRMAEITSDKSPENQEMTFDSGKDDPVKAKEEEPFFELELEPLELDIELEESDKKVS